MEKLPIEYFKTINLYDVYGEKVFEKKTTSEWEKICKETFKGLEKTENHQKNMGDFVKVKKKYYQKIKKYVVLDTTFLDHKNGKVLTENVGGRSYFIKVKYSNVNSKMWIQMAMRELDEIMKHVDLGNKIKILRYKTEFTIYTSKDNRPIHRYIRDEEDEGLIDDEPAGHFADPVIDEEDEERPGHTSYPQSQFRITHLHAENIINDHLNNTIRNGKNKGLSVAEHHGIDLDY